MSVSAWRTTAPNHRTARKSLKYSNKESLVHTSRLASLCTQRTVSTTLVQTKKNTTCFANGIPRARGTLGGTLDKEGTGWSPRLKIGGCSALRLKSTQSNYNSVCPASPALARWQQHWILTLTREQAYCAVATWDITFIVHWRETVAWHSIGCLKKDKELPPAERRET